MWVKSTGQSQGGGPGVDVAGVDGAGRVIELKGCSAVGGKGGGGQRGRPRDEARNVGITGCMCCGADQC